MEPVPYHNEDLNPQPVYHVIPDLVKGGWNVYITSDPQEPQRHFETKEDAVTYAENMSLVEGVGLIVEDVESPSLGRS